MKDDKKEWISIYGTAFKRYVKERGRSYRGTYYTIMSGFYCIEHEIKAIKIKTEKRYCSTMTDRGRLGIYWDDITWECPICKKTYIDSDNRTERDENYYSNEERRVYNID